MNKSLRHFYSGERLRSEVCLQARLYLSDDPNDIFDLVLFRRSLGAVSPLYSAATISRPINNPHPLESHLESSSRSRSELIRFVLCYPHYPDAILTYFFRYIQPTSDCLPDLDHKFTRLLSLLFLRFHGRPDLIYAVLSHHKSGIHFLRHLPPLILPANSYYSNTHLSLLRFQEMWIKGRYEELYFEYALCQFRPRWFPQSDFMLRGLTIIGSLTRVDKLFRQIFRHYSNSLPPSTLSNIIFTALGLESIDYDFLHQVLSKWSQACSSTVEIPLTNSRHSLPLTVSEKPRLAIISADLRNHPVGRFWLPIARCLSTAYTLNYFSLNSSPGSTEPVSTALRDCSDTWLDYSGLALEPLLADLTDINPDIILDLGSHTADNLPSVLQSRIAPLQISYLGFYGPTFARNADWWIIDSEIHKRISGSYPSAEPPWLLQGPSLCYDVDAHLLPDLETIQYTNSSVPVFGSFNHTRKLSQQCLRRFADILVSLPDAYLQIRSHSFQDPSVRRRVLQECLYLGINASQVHPLPYASSAVNSLLDYRRIHCHLDTYPTSGTTTTLDSLSMGIPVLTCPNNLYAGAISAALLDHAGLSHLVCPSETELTKYAQYIYQEYSSISSRRALAKTIRSSSLCSPSIVASNFSHGLSTMLKAKRS